MKLKLEKSISAKKVAVQLPKKDMSAIIKQAILNNKKKKTESVAAPEPVALAPKPVEKKPEINSILKQKVDKQLTMDLKESGEKPPSDIAQALAEDGMSENGSSEEVSGFVGKYLQKQRDLKNKAQQTVLQ